MSDSRNPDIQRHILQRRKSPHLSSGIDNYAKVVFRNSRAPFSVSPTPDIGQLCWFSINGKEGHEANIYGQGRECP